MIAILLACSDYGFSVSSKAYGPLDDDDQGLWLLDEDARPGDGSDDGGPGSPDGGSGGGSNGDGTGNGDGSGSGDQGTEEPGDEYLWDCPEGTAAWLSDELVLLATHAAPATGTLWVAEPGVYHLYDTATAESGPSQLNESMYLRISNSHNPSGSPEFGNCGDNWIVADADNGGSAPAPMQYVGTFELEAGPNTVTMYHYCWLYQAGQCTTFHNEGATSCPSGNWNSVHLAGTALCLVH